MTCTDVNLTTTASQFLGAGRAIGLALALATTGASSLGSGVCVFMLSSKDSSGKRHCPVPATTTPMVLASIFKSSHTLQLST
jgi:hypothetical protein